MRAGEAKLRGRMRGRHPQRWASRVLVSRSLFGGGEACFADRRAGFKAFRYFAVAFCSGDADRRAGFKVFDVCRTQTHCFSCGFQDF